MAGDMFVEDVLSMFYLINMSIAINYVELFSCSFKFEHSDIYDFRPCALGIVPTCSNNEHPEHSSS